MKAKPRYCENCEVHVRPVRHPLQARLMEAGAWFVALATFLFIGSLAPVVLVAVVVPMLCVAAMLGPLHERTQAPPSCPLCNRVLPTRTLAEADPREVPAVPMRPVGA